MLWLGNLPLKLMAQCVTHGQKCLMELMEKGCIALWQAMEKDEHHFAYNSKAVEAEEVPTR